jgi:ABC-type uncharacterized transport system substrate-binding protein
MLWIQEHRREIIKTIQIEWAALGFSAVTSNARCEIFRSVYAGD